VEYLRQYVDTIEKGPAAPGTLTRRGTDAMVAHVKVGEGQSVLVQESFDTPWHARSGGRELAVRKDAMGFMVIDTPPGQLDVELTFETPLENKVGRVLTGLTVAGLLVLVWAGRRA